MAVKNHINTLNVACYVKQLSLVENIFRNKGSQSLNPARHLSFYWIKNLRDSIVANRLFLRLVYNPLALG